MNEGLANEKTTMSAEEIWKKHFKGYLDAPTDDDRPMREVVVAAMEEYASARIKELEEQQRERAVGFKGWYSRCMNDDILRGQFEKITDEQAYDKYIQTLKQ